LRANADVVSTGKPSVIDENKTFLSPPSPKPNRKAIKSAIKRFDEPKRFQFGKSSVDS